ncbi:hypothetical protein COLO4_01257 [Corchorus olitorius]|uniref:Uncharacterized protein n=1 Tax=Corchorus olitorius TaxID=93759 RepID=A0A1R3L2Q3_9ROSI|nr:hypothetical protein COLO4_01257 [Corchorus olitorius]
MRKQLPMRYKTQFFVRTAIKDVEFYGMVDVVGGDRAIDIKTTARYQAPKFAHHFQNLYLFGLKSWNIKQLDYLITDFQNVYTESYHYDSYDFQPLLDELELFTEFLEQHPFDLSRRGIPTAQAFQETFHKVNAELWHLHDSRQISQDELRYRRFRQVISQLGCEDDDSCDEWSEWYLSHCPYKPHLLPGALELLDYLAPRKWLPAKRRTPKSLNPKCFILRWKKRAA